MSTNRRATVYFDPELHRGLRLLAAETERSVSDLVNDAVRARFADDVEDLAVFTQRATEPMLDFEEFVAGLRERGQL